MIEHLVKAGVGTAHEVKFSKEQIQRQFGSHVPSQVSSGPTRQQANNSSTKYPQANDTATVASAGGSVEGQMSEEAEEVYLDVSLLDQKVREQIMASGANYDFDKAVENGTMIKLPVELWEAIQRFNAAVPAIRKRMAQYAERLLAKTGGSASGSGSGSISGSESGSVSGEESGSPSGHVSKTLIARFMAGDQEAGLKLMGRR